MKEYTFAHDGVAGEDSSRIYIDGEGSLPIEVLNGQPGFDDLWSALGGWQLVSELKTVLRLPAAASYNRGPIAAALGIPLSTPLKRSCFVDDIEDLSSSALACALARARGSDRLSSNGDWTALSEPCDVTTARLIEREPTSGVIAPGYEPAALKLLQAKQKGSFKIVRFDAAYVPEEVEVRQKFGICFERIRDENTVDPSLLEHIVTSNTELPVSAVRDLLLSLITLKYAYPNSICCAKSGQTIGVVTGQQSIVHGMRLMCFKMGNWFLRKSPKVLSLPFWKDITIPLRDKAIDSYIQQDELDICSDGLWPRFFTKRPEPFPKQEQLEILREKDNVALSTDLVIDFPDTIERAHQCGIRYIVQPGGAPEDREVVAHCNSHYMVMALADTRVLRP